MGKVTIQITLQNWGDIELLATSKRKRPARAVETEALVVTGAVKLYLQRAVIQKLGLRPIGEVRSRRMSEHTVQTSVKEPFRFQNNHRLISQPSHRK